MLGTFMIRLKMEIIKHLELLLFLMPITISLYGCKAVNKSLNDDSSLLVKTNSTLMVRQKKLNNTARLTPAIQAIFDKYQCTTCHAGTFAAEGLVLTFDKVYRNIVNVESVQKPKLKLINLGQAERSYLLKKMRGDSDISGLKMPIGMGGATDKEIQMIINWINAGEKL